MLIAKAVLHAALMEEIKNEEQRTLFRRMLTAEGQLAMGASTELLSQTRWSHHSVSSTIEAAIWIL